MRRLFLICCAGAFLNAAAFAGTLLYWDFENPVPPSGDPQTFAPVSYDPAVSGFASHTGGGAAEWLNQPEGYVLMTRYFGSWYQPYIDFTTTAPLTVSDLTFQSNHNHNQWCCASYPGYNVQLQLDSGGSWIDVGAPFYVDQTNDAETTTVDLNLQFQPGTYEIRWYGEIQGYDPYGGHSTNTDYFALNNVALDGNLATPEPASLLLMIAGSLLLFLKRALKLSTFGG
jgi:hypothetical protein